MPRKSNVTPIPANDAPEPASPIQQLTGHVSADEMASELPSSTTMPDSRPRGPNGRLLRADGSERAAKGSRRSGASAQPPANPLLDDPRYKKAIQSINFFGAPRMINSGFSAAAVLMNDSDMRLSDSEKEAVDDYFYALSKHIQFDPMANLLGRILVLLALLGELMIKRVMKYTDIGKWLVQFAAEKKPPKPATETFAE